jgi:hypothetical protein
MDWNRVEGNWKEVKGKVKQKWAKLIDFRRCHKPDILPNLAPSALPRGRRCNRIARQ